MTEPTAATTLPCGCWIDNVGDTFAIKPCSPTCQYYLYALQESARQGNEMLPPIIDPAVSDDALAAFGLDRRATDDE